MLLDGAIRRGIRRQARYDRNACDMKKWVRKKIRWKIAHIEHLLGKGDELVIMSVSASRLLHLRRALMLDG